MKTFFFLFFMGSFYAFNQNEIRLRGTIKLYNPKSEFPREVTVKTDSGVDSYTSLDGLGTFELVFPKEKNGQVVKLSVTKIGWRPVFEKELDITVRHSLNPKNLVIHICRDSELNDAIKAYADPGIIRVLAKEREEEIEKQIKSLRTEIISAHNDISHLETEITFLTAERNRSIQTIEELDREIKQRDANPNMYNLKSQVEVNWNQYYNPDSALTVLSLEKLNELYQKAKETFDESNIKAANANFLLRAKLLIGTANWNEASICYEIAVSNDLTNANILAEAGNFFALKGNYSKAIAYFESSLDQNIDNSLKAYILASLSSLYLYNFELDKAKRASEESLELYKELEKKLEKYKPIVGGQLLLHATVFDNDLNLKKDNIEKAIERYESLLISEKDLYAPYLTMSQVQYELFNLAQGSEGNKSLKYNIDSSLMQITEKKSNLYYLMNSYVVMIKIYRSFYSVELPDSLLNLVSRINLDLSLQMDPEIIAPKDGAILSLEKKIAAPYYIVPIYNEILKRLLLVGQMYRNYDIVYNDSILKLYLRFNNMIQTNPGIAKQYKYLIPDNLSSIAVLYSKSQQFTLAREMADSSLYVLKEIMIADTSHIYQMQEATLLINYSVINLNSIILGEKNKSVKKTGKKYVVSGIKLLKQLKKENDFDLAMLDINLQYARRIKKQFSFNWRLARLVYHY